MAQALQECHGGRPLQKRELGRSSSQEGNTLGTCSSTKSVSKRWYYST